MSRQVPGATAKLVWRCFHQEMNGERAAVLVLSLFSAAGCTPSRTVVLNDSGSWYCYQDERVLVLGDRLIVGSVANCSGTDGETRRGNVEVTT